MQFGRRRFYAVDIEKQRFIDSLERIRESVNICDYVYMNSAAVALNPGIAIATTPLGLRLAIDVIMMTFARLPLRSQASIV